MNRILVGDVLKCLAQLEDESVQCVVTSPPYWGLRDYGTNGQIGLESTPDEYISKMVAVFREVKRVLRKDGTCWVNMGDSYSSFRDSKAVPDSLRGDDTGTFVPIANNRNGKLLASVGLKHKDLVGIPWMLAFALRADGWYLRQDIIWAKPNPMPESVTDRCTKSHEYIFLLTKSERYFYDAEAIKEPQNETTLDRFANGTPRIHGDKERLAEAGEVRANSTFTRSLGILPNGRNKRSVWNVATQPFPEAHFATFPEKLIEPCILAGTSEKGCCSKCGAPWERIVEPSERYAKALGRGFHDHSADLAEGMKQCRGENRQNYARDVCGVHNAQYVTIGWQPTCKCGTADIKPGTVLDPFSGSGTTGLVALRYHRNFIGIELNPEYAAMGQRRIVNDAPMFNKLELSAVLEAEHRGE